MGNLCFSFLMPHESSIDFKKINTEIILNSFKSIGINAEASGRNDILVDGKKVIFFH
jgi:lipoate-protein ligase A